MQAASLVALNLNLPWWTTAAAEGYCLPVMNCEACLYAWLGCPIGMIGRSAYYLAFPVVVAVCVLVVGLIMGRFLCGWVCPMGLVQDLVHKIKTPKFHLPRPFAYLKYVFLIVTAIAVPLFFGLRGGGVASAAAAVGDDPFAALDAQMQTGDEGGEPGSFPYAAGIPEPEYVESPFFFCNFCPTAALQVALPAWIIDGHAYVSARGVGALVLRFGVLALVLVLSVGNHRFFCKVMCPIGALIALANKLTFHKIRLDRETCVSCKKCNKKCPMDVKVMEAQDTGRPVNRDTECIGCLTCEQVCPTEAISNNSIIGR